MNLGNYTNIILLILSVIISIILILYLFLKSKRTYIFYTFLWCHLLILNWCLGMIFELFCTDVYLKWIIVCTEYFSISFIGVSWILFSSFYTGKRRTLRIKKIIILLIPPVICYVMLLTNEYHHLFYKQFEQAFRIYGIFFWINVFQSYIYLLISNTAMIIYSLKQPDYRKEQVVLIILTSIIPVISNFVYVFKFIKMNSDLTPVSFSVSILLLTIAIFKYRFLDIRSNAMIKVFDNMKEGIIIVNNFNKITDFNYSFKNSFSDFHIDINSDMGDFCRYLANLKVSCSSELLDSMAMGISSPLTNEMVINNSQYFSVNVQPIFNSRNKLLGRVITFSDISIYKNLMEDLDIKNKELSLKNEALKEHLTTAAELASEKERNRIAQDIHDTLGHTMTILIALLEVCKITYKKDSSVSEKKLEQAVEVAREGLKQLRESLYQIKREEIKSENFISILKNLILGFELAGMKIELTSDKLDGILSEDKADVIYKVCKEALTNSLRHGKAENISIIIKTIENKIKLFILDDGCGCADINSGLGLKGMEKRVKEAMGSIVYGSDGETGFNIHVELPAGGKKSD